MTLNKFCAICLEYNSWNGFVFHIFRIEIQGKKKGFEGDLIGLDFGNNYLQFSILFHLFVIKKPII